MRLDIIKAGSAGILTFFRGLLHGHFPALASGYLAIDAKVLASAEAPVRADLSSADQVGHHGKTLAQGQTLSRGPGPDKLLRLADNERVLLHACRLLRAAVKSKR